MASHVGANNYRVKMGFKTKTYHVNMSKKYIAREPEVDLVHTSNKDDATIAVARVIYQDTDQELGKYETSFGQDDARTSLDFAVPVMWAKEKSRRVLSRKYH